VLEAFRPAAVGIGHVVPVHQHPQLVLMLGRAVLLKDLEMTVIHRDDEVEFLEVALA
jgi:hypothetical protein